MPKVYFVIFLLLLMLREDNMYCLFELDVGNGLYVSHTKNLTLCNKVCYMQHTDGRWYQGHILAKNESATCLKEIRENLLKKVPQVLVRECAIEGDGSFEKNKDTHCFLGEFINSDDSNDPDWNPSPKEKRYNFDSYDSASSEEKSVREDQISEVTSLASHVSNFNTRNSPAKQVPHLNTKNKNLSKKNFCMFCRTLNSQLPRHLVAKHGNEEKVKIFSMLPKGSTERGKMLEKIRKEGNFMYNTESLNKHDFISCRRPQKGKPRDSSYFRVCPSCKGYYSKATFSKHVTVCSPNLKNSAGRHLSTLSRQFEGKISQLASDTLKNFIIPQMRDDIITAAIRFDFLAITFGNKLCLKYRKQHLFPMIRSKLRLIGRFLMTLKNINQEVSDFASCFKPKFYKDIVKAINRVAGLDEVKSVYRAPATAFSLGTLLKKCGKLLETELIEQGNFENQSHVINFLKILEVDLPSSVNKTVEETQEQLKRQKKVHLPKTKDIRVLMNYLETNIDRNLALITEGLTFNIWKSLASYVLVMVHVFNRKRPGEVSRMLIEDFNNYELFDENDEEAVDNELTMEERKRAKKYAQFIIRGKKNSSVPVLINKKILHCLKIIIENRKRFNVTDDNPFVFGLPNTGNNKIMRHLQSDLLLRKFSQECGADHHKNLRSTRLRKHVATRTSLLRLKDDQVSGVCRFMGHKETTHKKFYVSDIPTRQIAEVSKILEVARGEHVGSSNTSGYDIEEHNTVNMVTNISSFNEHMEVEEISKNTSNDTNFDVYSDEEHELDHNCNRKKRSVSPYGHVKRTSWDSLERSIVEEEFEKEISEGFLPSLAHCEEVIRNTPDLQQRTSAQLKSFLSNQIKKKTLKSTGIQKRRWTTPEKTILKLTFEQHLKRHTKSLPSLFECRRIIKENDVLRNRSEKMVKAWVANEQNRLRKLKKI